MGGELEEVQQFCYLGDVLDCEAGVERAVRARVAASVGEEEREKEKYSKGRSKRNE